MAEDRRFREAQRYATAHGFNAGFPNFHQADYGDGLVYGTILFRETHVEWRDVPRTTYGVFHIEDVPALFRAANDFAGTQGYPAAFPNCEQQDHGAGVMYGTILMKPGSVEWRDVPRDELGVYNIDNVPAMMRAANDYAVAQGFMTGFPTFHQADHGAGVVCGIVCINQGACIPRDVHADLLALYAARPQRWAILLCNLNDRPPAPNARDRYVEYFTEAGAGTGGAFDYWRDMSYGVSGLRESAVLGFFGIPHSTAELVAISGSAQRRQAFDWGIEAAIAAGVRLQDFDHKIVVLNGGGTDHGQTGAGVTLVFADSAEFEPTFIFHEMGHEFDLDHSFGESLMPCAGGDVRPGAYCDRFDIMSAMNVASFQDARGRLTGPSLNGEARKRLGWLHRSRVRVYQARDATRAITLAAINRPDVDGFQLIEFRGSSRVTGEPCTYTVEFRENESWDAGLPRPLVVIHEVRADGLVRALTNTPRGNLDAGAEFVSPAPSVVLRVEEIDPVAHVASVRLTHLPLSGAREVRILNVLHDPPGPEAKNEYVLLQNDRPSSVDLRGWTLSDAAGHVFEFPTLAFAPGHNLRIWTGIGANDAENLYWGRRQAIWNNTGDVATLADAAGATISRFAYIA